MPTWQTSLRQIPMAIALAPVLDLAAAHSLKEILGEAAGAAIVLDGADVERVGMWVPRRHVLAKKQRPGCTAVAGRLADSSGAPIERPRSCLTFDLFGCHGGAWRRSPWGEVARKASTRSAWNEKPLTVL